MHPADQTGQFARAGRAARARQVAAMSGPRLGGWFVVGVLLVMVGLAGVAAGLLAGTVSLVPARVTELVTDAPEAAPLAAGGLLSAVVLVIGLRLAWRSRRTDRVEREAATPVEVVELRTRAGRGTTVLRASALTAAGMTDIAGHAGVLAAHVELLGDERTPVVRVAVRAGRGADLAAVRTAVADALRRMAATMGRSVEAAEVLLYVAEEPPEPPAGDAATQGAEAAGPARPEAAPADEPVAPVAGSQPSPVARRR